MFSATQMWMKSHCWRKISSKNHQRPRCTPFDGITRLRRFFGCNASPQASRIPKLMDVTYGSLWHPAIIRFPLFARPSLESSPFSFPTPLFTGTGANISQTDIKDTSTSDPRDKFSIPLCKCQSQQSIHTSVIPEKRDVNLGSEQVSGSRPEKSRFLACYTAFRQNEKVFFSFTL